MREFFRGWRRKVGVVTLVMACVMTGMWFRSRTEWESLEVAVGARGLVAVELERGSVTLAYRWLEENTPLGTSISASSFNWHGASPVSDEINLWPELGTNLWSETSSIGPIVSGKATYVRLPLLTAMALLTVVSAYLLLWKPRKRTEPEHA